MKQKFDEKLKPLDAEISALYETRDILTGRLHTIFSKPYEVVISFPASLGERGFRLSMYYDDIPEAEQIYTDFRKEIRDFIKDNSGSSEFYREQASKIAKKVLRVAKIK